MSSFSPRLEAAPELPPYLVRQLLPEQRSLDAFVQDLLADYASTTGNDHEHHGLPYELDVVVVGAGDLIRAIGASPTLRNRTPDELEDILLNLSDGGNREVVAPEHFQPFMVRHRRRSVDLGVRLTSHAPGSAGYDRDVLQSRIHHSQPRFRFTPMQTFRNETSIVLLTDVDPIDEGHLVDSFGINAVHFSGEIALGPMELVLGQPSR
ncbi:hypothetical protein KDA14_02830 [Candidatus Saccharibacteria bacterium]|nr:hypothetical protein [Candidatus Saccharibacteria bacterium]